MPATDILTPADVVTLVDQFYARVNEDALLGPIFNEVARIDWEHHLPRMYAFWQSLIFATASYKGNPFAKHIPLPIDAAHFERWLALFSATVDDHFAGPVAEQTKQRARSIGHIFQTKLAYLR